MEYPIFDPISWKQYIPKFDPESTMGIKNTSFQTYLLMNPGGSFIERSMLTIYELAVLYMLAKDYYTGEGEIIDLGPLLGVNTNALARGLHNNKKVVNKNKRIFVFDLFLSKDMGSIISDPCETGSVFDRFLRNNIDFLKYISISPGNLLDMNWKKSKIEILFIDISKNWDLNTFVIQKFFNCLIPQKSVVIQQDYVHFNEYWIHITMEYFSDYFELLYIVNGSSAVYLYKSEIPNSMLYKNIKDFSLKEKIYYLDKAREKAMPSVKEVMKCAQAYCLIEHEFYEDAIKILQTIDFNSVNNTSINDPTLDFSKILLSNANIVNDLLKQRYGKSALSIEQKGELFDTNQRENLLGNIKIVLEKTEISSKEKLKGCAQIENIGTTIWQLSEMPVGTVHLGSHLLSADGKEVIVRDFSRHKLVSDDRKDLKPGDCVSFPIEIEPPPYGKYILEFDLVAEMICWFAQNRSLTIKIPINII